MTSLSETSIISGSSGQSTGYDIDQSIRFNDGDSPYMARTFGTATNAKKWTMSGWAKIAGVTDGASGGVRFLDVGGSSGTDELLSIGSGYAGYEKIYFWSRTSSSYDWRLETTQLFRDPAAWYHLVFVYDSDNTLEKDRMILYVNGERITAFAQEVYPSSGEASRINTAVAHRIGASVYAGNHSNGYQAEMNFIDGQALTPASFGEFNGSNIWVPIQYTGSYGNNGFHIDGSDSGTLGKNVASGNTFASFASSGLASHDQFIDTPTDNYCVLNPLSNRLMTFSNGNMEVQAASGTAAHKMVKSTMGIPPTATGKYFWEWQVPSSTSSGDVDMIGLCDLDDGLNTEANALNAGHGYGIGYKIGTGEEYLGTGWTDNSFTFGGFVASNYYGFAYDASTGRLYIYQNGTIQNSGAHVATFDRSATIAPGLSVYNNTNAYKFFNGAQNSLTNSNFNYAPPTGYGPINSSSIGTEF